MFERFRKSNADGGKPPSEPPTAKSPFDDAIKEIIGVAIRKMNEANPLFTFKNAFLDTPGYIQRDVDDVQQVIDEVNEINFELEDRLLLISLRDNQIEGVIASLQRALASIFQIEVSLKPTNAYTTMPNAHLVDFRTSPSSIHAYRVMVYSGQVPAGSGTHEPGTQIAVSYSVGFAT